MLIRLALFILWGQCVACLDWTLLSGGEKEQSPPPLLAASGAIIDDSLFIFGGCTSSCCFSPVATVWSFDLITDKWKQWQPSNDSPQARFGSVATESDVKLVVFGGWKAATGPTSSTWVFDPADASWELLKLESSPPPRAFHAHTNVDVVSGSYLVIFGGIGAEGNILDDIWILNLETFEWKAAESMGEEHPALTKASLMGTGVSETVELLVVGGADAPGQVRDEVWKVQLSLEHPVTAAWSRQSEMEKPSARYGQSVLQPRGDPSRSFVFGGQTGTLAGAPYLSDLWQYSSFKGQWNELHSTGPDGRGDALAAPIDESSGILFGGFSGFFGDTDDRLLNDLWLWKTSEETYKKANAISKD